MSNSFKQSPVFKDSGTQWMKRQASKAVRRYAGETANGRFYRKLFCSWNICDYRFYRTKMQALSEMKSWFKYRETEETVLRDWQKYYRRK